MIRNAASNATSVGWARSLVLCFLALLAAASNAALVAIEAANTAATFRVANTKDSGTGSLRQAILDANAVGGVDAITFDIPGSGVKTITPASALPTIDEAVRINGYTQRSCSANPAPYSRPNTSAVGTNARLLVQLNGANTTSSPGLYIGAPNVLVKGLVINRFDGDGVELDG